MACGSARRGFRSAKSSKGCRIRDVGDEANNATPEGVGVNGTTVCLGDGVEDAVVEETAWPFFLGVAIRVDVVFLEGWRMYFAPDVLLAVGG